MFTHINWKAHAVCDLNITLKGERRLKVTRSHAQEKSDNIWQTVLDGDVVTTGH